MRSNNSTFDHARQYASMGWKTFPVFGISGGVCDCVLNAECPHPGKHPILNNWPARASTHLGALRTWFSGGNANIGICTGAINKIVVLDVDAGQEGLENLRALGLTEAETDTLTVETGGGGKHFYYQHPGYPIRNSANKLGEKIDLRGDGGFVCAAPSLHMSGRRYEWLAGCDYPIAPFPETLARLIEASPQQATNLQPGTKQKSGGRNVYLTSQAGTLRRGGMNPETLRITLQGINQGMCDPPLPGEEVDTIAASIGKKPAGSPLMTLGHSEGDYAKRMALHHGGRIHYVKGMKRWMVFNGRHWEYDDSGHVGMQGLAKEMLAATYQGADLITDSAPDDQAKKRQDFRRKVKGKDTRGAIDSIIALTASEPGIMVRAEELDNDPWLFNVQNGTLDLRTGKLSPHDAGQRISLISPVVFDEKATCPKWEKFVDQVFAGDQKLAEYVQRVLGYMLTGDTKEQQFVIAIGGGCNGKSTTINTMLKVLGTGPSGFGASTQFSTWDADNKNQLGNDLAALRGKRAVFAVESQRERSLNEARIKQVSGGDEISCRFLYGDYFSYTPSWKAWLVVNHTPIIRNFDRGLWRRLKWLPFKMNFEATKDLDLASKLSKELPGVLNWLIAGLQQWQKIGMAEPESVLQATEEIRIDSDTFGQYLGDRSRKVPGAQTPAAAFYLDYRLYCDLLFEGKYAIGHKQFGINLLERGYLKKHTEKGNIWLDVELTCSGDQQRTRLDRTMGGYGEEKPEGRD